MKSRIGAATAGAPWLGLLLSLGLAGNIAGWLLIGPLPDEAYYWVWSERLQAGYYDHPPLIAWMTRPFTELFGDSGWSLRLPSVVSWFIGAGLAWALAFRLFGTRRAAFAAVLIWTSMPIVQIGFHVNTPDTPLVLFAWATFYFAIIALERGEIGAWLAAGACAGLALAGKYPGVLVPGALFIGLALTRAGRSALATRGPWVGGIAAMAVFAPVVVWNWKHEWISFAFQFHHGVQTGSTPVAPPVVMLGQFIGGQLAVVSPWTWAAMVFAALPLRAQVARVGSERFAVLAAGFWLPLVVFGLAGLTAKSHPNWPVVAYIPGTLLLAGAVDRWLDRSRRVPWLVMGGCYFLGVLAVNLMRFPQWLQSLPIELPPQRTQLSQTYGWEEVRPVLDQLLAGKGSCTVLGDRLQSASMLALILDDVDRVAVPEETRTNQFHLWQREAPVREPCLYFEQYDADEKIPLFVNMKNYGRWRREQVVEHRNPDFSVRRSAFFLPDRGD